MAKQTSNKKVVLLEDEATLANLYMSKLKEAGFEVMLFEGVDELIRGIDNFKADVAFLDHALHGAEKSGLDVIPALKKSNPKMKVAMLSNYSEFQMEQKAKEAGADDYLLKINTSPATLVSYAEEL